MHQYIEKLLNGQKVEWKTLGEVCTFVCSGGTPSRKNKEYYNGDIPWLRTQEVDWKDVYETELKITKEAIKNSSAKLIPKNCVIVAMYGATAAKVCINKIPLTTNQACCNLHIDETKALYRYIFYCISNQYEQLKAKGEGSQSNLNANKIKNLLIPLPPLSVQHKIVSILDKFTQLEAELEAELNCRKRQYQYYRDKVLSIQYLQTKGPVQYKTLGEVAEIYGGLKGKNKHDFEHGNALFIPYKNILDNLEVNINQLESVCIASSEKQYAVKYGDILFTGSSETPNEVGMSCAVTTHFDKPIYLNSFSFGIRFYDEIQLTPQFAKYLFRCDTLRKQIIKTANGVTRYNVSKSRFKNLLIPLPPLSVQHDIVKILDTFSSLCDNISEGLPKEIALRRKQYEYYRNQLLSFD